MNKKNSFYIASKTQDRIWLANEVNKDSSYNIYTGLNIEGELDNNVIKRAIEKLIYRHDILRSNFIKLDDKLIRRINHDVDMNLFFENYKIENKNNINDDLIDLLPSSLDLSQDTLFRALLLETEANRKILVFTFHHIIADGWSTGLFLKEFSSTLNELINKKAISNKTPIKGNYNDFVDNEAKYINSHQYNTDKLYWETRINGNNVFSDLPKKQSSNNIRKSGNTKKVICFDDLNIIKKECKDNHTTLFSYLLTAYKVVLYKYTSQTNHIIGVPVVNRDKVEFENILGYFGNMIPHICPIDNKKSFFKNVKCVQNVLFEDLDHQKFPYNEITKMNNNIGNYLKTVFTLQNDPNELENIDKINIKGYKINNRYPKFDLSLVAYEENDELFLDMEYDTSKYDSEFIESFMRALQCVVCNKEKKSNTIQELEVLDIRDIKNIITQNVIYEKLSPTQNLYDLFVEACDKYGSHIAVSNNNELTTYTNLLEKVNSLSNLLISKNIKKHQNIGILMDKGELVITTILAILKIGARYIPIDPNYPLERKKLIIEDANIKICLSDRNYEEFECINLSEIKYYDDKHTEMECLSHKVSLNDVAYIMYTSGTTGNPKGVQITHKNIISFAKNPNFLKTFKDDKIMLFSTLAFDASTFEIYVSLLNGVTIEVFNDSLPTLDHLTQFIKDKNITILFLTSGLFQKLEDSHIDNLRNVRYLLTGGDRISLEVASRVSQKLSNTNLLNCYGPTENTVFTTFHVFNKNDSYQDGVPIGVEVNNTETYVLNNDMNILPDYAEGELYVGGDGVSVGYTKSEKRNKKSFVENPYKKGEILYKTGDIVRRNNTGEIFYLGRTDNQIKIRGFRVELEEIENIILKNETVNSVVCLLKEDEKSKNKKIIAYYIGNISSENLRKFVSQLAPNFMIPANFICVEEFPLKTNGKVDINKLSNRNFEIEHGNSLNKNNQELDKVWSKYLGLPENIIGNDDDFFELGGDSITAIQIVSELNKKGYDLKPIDILNGRTINSLVSKMNSESNVPISSDIIEMKKTWSELLQIDEENLKVSDDFFELGGDSIIAIQIVSALNRKGYDLKPIDILNLRTIEKISKVITNTQLTKKKINSYADIYNTPIQTWFFKQNIKNFNHFNMGQSFSVPVEINIDDLIQSLVLIINNTPTFKVRYKKMKNEFIPYTKEYKISKEDISISDFSNLKQDEKLKKLNLITNKANKEIDIINGPILKIHIFRNMVNDKNILYITVHHLYIDGISWRIILSHLNDLLLNKTGRNNYGADNNSNYFAWSHKLIEYSKSDVIKEDIKYWDVTGTFLNPWEQKSPTIKNRYYKKQMEIDTSKILNSGFKINEFLLGILYITLNKHTRLNNIVINLEGHGREYIDEDLNLGEIIGWFTSIFPLPLSNVNDKLENLTLMHHIKSVLSSIPYNGLTYGVDRYIGSNRVKKFPEYISFNYMGRYDTSILNEDKKVTFDNFISGFERNENNPLYHAIELNCSIIGNQLQMNWSYNSCDISEYEIKEISDIYTEEFNKLYNQLGLLQSDETEILLNYQNNERLKYKEDNQPRSDNKVYTINPTDMQKGMVFHTLLDPQKSMYIVQSIMDINNNLNIAKFKSAWEKLVQNNELLKARFEIDTNKDLILKVDDKPDLNIKVIDFSDASEDEFESKFHKFIENNRKEGIDVFSSPMMNLTLFKKTDKLYRLVWTYHHAILDGWSFNIFIEKFMNIYFEDADIEEDRTFSEYIKHPKYKSEYNLKKSFWLEEMKNFDVPTHLNIEKSSNNSSDFINNSRSINLDISKLDEIKKYIKDNKISLNTFCLSTWLFLLYKYSGSTKVVTGLTTSGRNNLIDNADKVCGPLINSIPFILDIEYDSVKNFMNSVQNKIWTLQEYDDVSLEDIKNEINLDSNENIFNFLYVFENYPDMKISESKSLNFTNRYSIEHTNYPLTITIKGKEKMIIEVSYDSNVYHDQDIEYLLESYINIMINFIDNKNLSDIKLLNDHQQKEIDYHLSGIEYILPKDDNIIRRFKYISKYFPDNIALQLGDKTVSYRDLDRLSDIIARNLMKNNNISKSCIAIHMDKCIEMFVSIIGILKSGNSYCVIDPELPLERKEIMLKQANIQYVIIKSLFNRNFDSQYLVYNDLVLEMDYQNKLSYPEISHDDTIYINFTSGSTGTPKGIKVSHGNILYMYEAWYRNYNLEDMDNYLQMANTSFDVFQGDWIRALITGKKLVICTKEELMNPKALYDLICKNNIHFGEFVPFVLRQLLNYLEEVNGNLNTFKKIIIASDTWNINDYERLKQFVRSDTLVLNSYGLTETTIDSTYFVLNDEVISGDIPIGIPFDNQEVKILDKNKHSLPVNVPGEIYIGGKTVSKGYVNYTNSDFYPIDNTDKKHFKTGDYAKLNHQGKIELIGRIGTQVKLRGMRIELSEIENQILKYPNIHQCFIMLDGELDDKLIIAYITSNEEINIILLRQLLENRLPYYMVPNLIVQLDNMPLTTSGKIDKKALPKSHEISKTNSTVNTQPENLTQKSLFIVWKELLNIDEMDINSDFYALGGNSFLLMRMNFKIKEKFEIDIPLFELIKRPTIKNISELIDERMRAY